LGFGKKVYLFEDTAQWRFFTENDIEVYSLKNFDLTPIDPLVAERNSVKIKKLFSSERLASDLKPLVTLEEG
jgi:hypothetical protein